jgi:molybdate transport system permease protein
MRRLGGAVLATAVLLTFAFALLPVVALFTQVSPARLVGHANDRVFLDALYVSLKTSLIAHAFVLVFGTAVAWVLARRRFRGRRLLISLIDLPLVLPPAVAGIALLATFGRNGLLGDVLHFAGLRIPLTQAAVSIAVAFVELPIYVRAAIAAFESLDATLLDASRTLGSGPARTFRRVALPLAAGGLAAGSSLAWARGLGEFGATLMFAGSLQGLTQTLPLAIYAQLNVDYPVALAIGALLVLVSVAVVILVRLTPSWTRFASIWPIASAPSGSS